MEHQRQQVFVDAQTVARQGVPLSYPLLIEELARQSGTEPAGWQGFYFATEPVPEPKNPKEKEAWLWEQQQREAASAAGFALELSPPWREKIPCLYCSCLNPVYYPAPVLLAILGRLWERSLRPDAPLCHILTDSLPLIQILLRKNETGRSPLEAGRAKLLYPDPAPETAEQLRRQSPQAYSYPVNFDGLCDD